MTSSRAVPLKVLIVGGGVAALEAALALRAHARERVAITLLAPDAEFHFRPLTVREPFNRGSAHRYPLGEICSELGIEHVQDSFRWLAAGAQVVYTETGDRIRYDALLLAPGATRRTRLRHALTVDDRQLDEQLHGLVQDVEQGYASKLAFAIPDGLAWPLPIYELALMTGRAAWEAGLEVSITLLTPEKAPLAVFGERVSRTVARLLEERGVLAITSAHPETPEPGQVSAGPRSRPLHVDRVVALPELRGPGFPEAAAETESGFIPVDGSCRVAGLANVWAAGDATDFPVKFGGIAAQQADAAASQIATLAGAAAEPEQFRPTLHAVLLGADRPLYLSAALGPDGPTDSEATPSPAWSESDKVAARHLSPYLASRDRAAVR